MNITKRILGMLFIGLASTALFIACGDETSCVADGDCADTDCITYVPHARAHTHAVSFFL